MQKDSVNFSIYSSDWTNMNLKSKKLLLLAMNMNNVNWLQMKASPRRHVDLQQFLNVIVILAFYKLPTFFFFK
jgi:hypothetical protein